MQNKNHPEIRIKDAWLSRANASQYLHELWSQEGDVLADDEQMKEIVSAYSDAWKKYDKKILRGICDLYDLQFIKTL